MRTFTVEEQLRQILATCRPLEPFELPVLEAAGCVSAEDVLTESQLPPFPTVTQEGYAVRSVDVVAAASVQPLRLTVIDQVRAGFRPTQPLAPGTAIRVGVGAMLPPGADAVVPITATDQGLQIVAIGQAVVPGQGFRPAGAVAETGQIAVPKGTLLGPVQLAAAAAAGRSRIAVHAAPRVVVITVGSELAEPSAPLQTGLIRDADAVLICAATTMAGAVAYRAGPVPDDPAVLATVIEGQLVRADVIIVVGGMGGVTTAALQHLGCLDLAHARLDPGPAVGYGTIEQRIPIFSIPGEPVAAFVAHEVFLRPAIRRLMGQRHVFRPVVRARLRAGVEADAGVRRFAPAAVSGRDGNYLVEPVPAAQASSLLAAVSVNCLIVIPEETPVAAAGEDVLVIRLDRQ